MDERKKSVLQAIIQDYIETAEPVGSRTIARKYNLGVSSATIRNEMSDLEELGLIEQPHTSAGRIPSDLGYRYYVDCLMEREALDDLNQDKIKTLFSQKIGDIETAIKIAGEALSAATNYTSLILGPNWGKHFLQNINLIYLSPGNALLLISINSYLIHNQLIAVPENLTPVDLERINLIFNSKISGYNLDALKKDLIDDLYREFSKHKKLINDILEIIVDSISQKSEEKVYLGGTLNILNQPEFKNIDKLKNLLTVLDQKNIIKDILRENVESSLAIKIGGENRYEVISDCSIITASYKIGGEVIGSLGIIGPTRMPYSKAISLVECVTENLSEVLGKMFK